MGASSGGITLGAPSSLVPCGRWVAGEPAMESHAWAVPKGQGQGTAREDFSA